MGRDVDKKIPRKIVVQIKKINFGDMHKNLHLLGGVNCNHRLALAQ